MRSNVLLVIILCLLLRDQLTQGQKVTHLPGLRQDDLVGLQSGYIDIGKDADNHLFYLLVESERSPATDPLILWLTGGPGCSSLDAFTYENGPYHFSFKSGSRAPFQVEDVDLSPNPYSWSKLANVLYVDSPLGTGMSFTDGELTYKTDDSQTVQDLTSFVVQFLEQNPELQKVDLYLSGESYAGVYVPLLAQSLLRHNARGSSLVVNLVGYMVGNGVTDDYYDGQGQVPFAHGMGLVAEDLYLRIQETCDRTYWNAQSGTECQDLIWEMEDAFGDLNIYSILDPCFHTSRNSEEEEGVGVPSKAHRDRPTWSSRRLRALVDQKKVDGLTSADHDQGAPGMGQQPASLSAGPRDHEQRQLRRAAGRVWPVAPVRNGSTLTATDQVLVGAQGMLGHTIACADRRHALLWYNDPEVRTALHAAPVSVAGRWEPCSDVLSYRMNAGSMLPVHRDNLQRGLQVLIYSGDHDYVVPFTGTRAWVYAMRLAPHQSWHAWRDRNHQVAGYAVSFANGDFTFATVKGAGHMVPQTRPALAFELVDRWLRDSL